jgi:hypothetical protein
MLVGMTATPAPEPFQGVTQGTWDMLDGSSEPFVEHLGYQLKNSATEPAQQQFNALIIEVCQFSRKRGEVCSFSPTWVKGEKRSMLPEDLHEDALRVLAKAFTTCPHLDLKGRIGEILWTAAKQMPEFKKDRFGWVKDTVASYQTLVDAELPKHGGQTVPYSHLRDRISLSAKLVAGVSNPQMASAHNAWMNRLAAGKEAQNKPQLVLDVRRLQLELEWITPVACHAEMRQFGFAQQKAGNHILACEGFDLALSAAFKTDDATLVKDAQVACGNARISQAKAYLQASPDAAAPAAHQYKQALEYLRASGADKAVTDPVQQELLRLNKMFGDTAGSFSIPLDFTDYATKLGVTLQSFELTQALFFFFFRMHTPQGYTYHQDSIDKKISESPFYSMIPMAKMSADGRVQAVAGSLEDEDSEAPARIFYEVAEQQSFVGMALRVARHVFLEHHPIDRYVCEQVVNASPLVPLDRKYSVTLGLLRGWEGRWLESMHLLMPQLEQMIRQLLLSQGVVVTKTDPTQQDFIDLGGMLANHEELLAKLLGEGEVLALRAACAERLGHNRRNDLSHGLVPDREFGSPSDIYLWWLIFRVVVAPLFSNSSKDSVPATAPVEEASEAPISSPSPNNEPPPGALDEPTTPGKTSPAPPPEGLTGEGTTNQPST